MRKRNTYYDDLIFWKYFASFENHQIAKNAFQEYAKSERKTGRTKQNSTIWQMIGKIGDFLGNV